MAWIADPRGAVVAAETWRQLKAYLLEHLNAGAFRVVIEESWALARDLLSRAEFPAWPGTDGALQAAKQQVREAYGRLNTILDSIREFSDEESVSEDWAKIALTVLEKIWLNQAAWLVGNATLERALSRLPADLAQGFVDLYERTRQIVTSPKTQAWLLLGGLVAVVYLIKK